MSGLSFNLSWAGDKGIQKRRRYVALIVAMIVSVWLGASAIDCWWNQHNPIMFNMLMEEMALEVLGCGKYRISAFVCWR